ncbi:MAG TPA: hypothetical protein VFC65_06585 [Prolixibacteraceae bacterium]|nr:hypothetical protein [Prolixibacteraceae bacterium]
MQKVALYFVFLPGVHFILNGMSMGIPYVSPKIEKLISKEMMDKGRCC